MACAADREYAIGLAVTIRSALENLDPARRLRLYLIDGGLSRGVRRQLLRAWDPDRVEVAWIEPDLRRIRELPIDDYVSHSTYLRLLLPEVLPASLERVIYLDSDLVVLGDLGALWERPFDQQAVLAAQDVGYPFIDAELALPNYAECAPYLWGARPIPNYVALGLDPKAKYFNGGVMLVDLAAWRREGLCPRMLECLRANREHAVAWDQYALNAVLAGRWGELDLRWNVPLSLFRYPSGRQSPFGETAWRQAIEAPFVVHFVGFAKPWYWGARGVYHPWQQLFERHLEGTGWPRWRRLRWTLLPVLRQRLGKGAGRAAKRLRAGARRLRRAARRLRGRAAGTRRALRRGSSRGGGRPA